MDFETVAKIIIAVASFLVGAIPTVTAMIYKIKQARAAKTEAERAKSLNELVNEAQGFIIEAENLYKSVDAMLKSQGESSGAQKKDSVMAKIQLACLEKGVAFDADFWSTKVDELVDMTRKVNAK